MALDIKNPYQAIIDVIDVILTKHEIAPDNISIHVCETSLPQSGLGSAQLEQIINKLKQSGAIEDLGKHTTLFLVKANPDALLNERKKLVERGGGKIGGISITPKKLNYYPATGEAEYKTALWQFKGKARAFLVVLHKNKNMNFNVEDIKTYCNPLIEIEKHKFKGEKDISDTLREIKYRLKASKGEFFPIFKQEKGWIWLEK